MRFIDIFIKRPVLATVISLLILVSGIGAFYRLQIRQYPQLNNATITVNTAYPGANPDTIQGFITTPLERNIGSVDGIDYMSSQSALGMSTITIKVALGEDPNEVLSQVVQKVNATVSQLPEEAESPAIDMEAGNTFPSLILSFTSDRMEDEEITAYIKNQLTPKLNALGGLSEVLVWGAKDYAMRVYLDYDRMAQFNVTPQEVSQALADNSLIAAGGEIKGPYLNLTLNPATSLTEAKKYRKLVVKNENGHLIRLDDVAKVELGAENYESNVSFNGKQGVFAGIVPASDANVLTVINRIKKTLPSIKQNMPQGLKVNTVYDNTIYISTSIKEVIKTLVEAIVIVALVLLAFVGSLRSVIIPLVAIPLSLIGAFFLMMLMGFSINLLTLLAMVLAIGLVVDDAIVVLENIYRHIESGMQPFKAAIKGAREIANPVILMTLTLVAVYLPIGMMSGISGMLFTQFAYSLAGAVVISGIVAYTFSPMLCSKILSPSINQAKAVKVVDYVFDKLKHGYRWALEQVLSVRAAVVVFIIAILGSCYFLFTGISSELAPTEDQAFIGIMGNAPSAAGIHYLEKFNKPIYKALNSIDGVASSFVVNGFPQSNSILGGVHLKPWDKRDKTQMELSPQLQSKLKEVAGISLNTFAMPTLPGVSFGAPVQFVLQTINENASLKSKADHITNEMMKSGLFVFAQSNLHFDNPHLVIDIDRQKAADLGITMSDIAQAFSTSYAKGYINHFNMMGYSYEVIPELKDSLKQTKEQLAQIQLRTAKGHLVPLSAIVNFKQKTAPLSLNRFQQLNSATINAVPAPGVSIGQAVSYLKQLAQRELPNEVSHAFSGKARQYLQNTGTMMIAFGFALIVIFLMLAAQFETFRDPFIILISVPMSIFGALVPLYLGQLFGANYASINIYTQVGLITLIGLISKHGILIVEFANKLQETGLDKLQAVIKSSTLRLRPILMTTFAMVMGVIPLVEATGAGAVSRNCIGVVIASGMLIGTLFTLFVVPVVYSFLATDRSKLMAQWAEEDKIIEQLNKRPEVE